MCKSNAERVRGVFAAQDISGFVARLHPDIEWDGTRVMPDATISRGHRAVEAVFRRFFGPWELDFAVRIEEAFDLDGNRAFAAVSDHGTSKGTGITVDRIHFQIWEFRDGLPVRVVVYPTRAEAMAAAGLEH